MALKYISLKRYFFDTNQTKINYILQLANIYIDLSLFVFDRNIIKEKMKHYNTLNHFEKSNIFLHMRDVDGSVPNRVSTPTDSGSISDRDFWKYGSSRDRSGVGSVKCWIGSSRGRSDSRLEPAQPVSDRDYCSIGNMYG